MLMTKGQTYRCQNRHCNSEITVLNCRSRAHQALSVAVELQ